MIQRIQSLFLFIIAIAMISFLFVNIWQTQTLDGKTVVTLNCLQLSVSQGSTIIKETTTAWLAGLAIVTFAAAMVSILSFKNRLRQLQIGMVISILISGILGGVVYYSFTAKNLVDNLDKGSYSFGLLIPALSIILNNLSNRFIRKDEETVRSADRIR